MSFVVFTAGVELGGALKNVLAIACGIRYASKLSEMLIFTPHCLQETHFEDAFQQARQYCLKEHMLPCCCLYKIPCLQLMVPFIFGMRTIQQDSCGAACSDGLGYGNNGRAALITRGLVEISRIALKLGANPLTLSGLAGMGDLVLTCTGLPPC